MIEVPFGSVQHVLPIIKEVTKDTKEFVPFQMRRKNPDAFQGAIRYQNHLLANQHVIMVNNLGMDAMYYLTDRIQAISGVRDVIPTRKVMDNGKFYILVDKNAAAGVRESLKNRFDRWYHEVVPDNLIPCVLSLKNFKLIFYVVKNITSILPRAKSEVYCTKQQDNIGEGFDSEQGQHLLNLRIGISQEELCNYLSEISPDK